MKKIIKKTILLSLFFAMLIPNIVLAAGSTQISISNPSPKVGDSFTVTVTGSQSSQLKVSFDSRVLELASSTVSGQTGSNSITVNTKEVTLTFNAKAEGTSGVIVSSSSLSGSSINVGVSGGGNAQAPAQTPEPLPQQTQAPANQTPATDTNVSNQVPDGSDFLVDGTGMVVSERYPDSSIPAGFSEVRLDINGKSVRELTNGVMTIIYLKPSDNIEGDGVFYIYDSGNGTVRRMDLIGSNTDYVILGTPDNLFSKRLVKTEVSFGEKVLNEVYTIEGSNSEFYYIYGTDENGANGWFAYDSLTGGVYRADVMSLSMLDSVENVPEQSEEPVVKEPKKDNFLLVSLDKLPFEIPEEILEIVTSKTFLMILAGFVILIILIFVITAIIKRKYADDDYDYEYEDDYEDDYEDEEYDEDEVKKETKGSFVSNANKGTSTGQSMDTPTTSLFNNQNPLDSGDGPKTSVLEPDDDLIDELIRKSNKENNMDIIDLDDL